MNVYEVQRGDSLSVIAKRNGVSVEYLAKINGIKDVNDIKAGQKLIFSLPENNDDNGYNATNLNEPDNISEHKVKRGDSLSKLAKQYGCTIDALKAANNLKSDTIYTGTTLIIPTINTKNKVQKTSKKTVNDEALQNKSTQEKSFIDFKQAIANAESKGNGGYKAENKLGYIGKYQFGEPSLIDVGLYKKDGTRKNDYRKPFTGKFGIKSKQDFLNSPKAQELAMDAYCKKQWQYLKAAHSAVGGFTREGTRITESALIAAAHLVGAKKVKNYILNGGPNAKDANGTSIEDYMKRFNDYNVEFITKPQK